MQSLSKKIAQSCGCNVRKREELRLKKLRMLEVIEADLKLVMRMFLGSRINERVGLD